MKMKNISVSMVTEDEVQLVELDGEPEAQTHKERVVRIQGI